MSDNFTIYSDDKDRNVYDLLAEFEVFRSAVLAVTGVENRPENSRMMILHYSRATDYRKIAPVNVIGFYSNTSAGPRMVVGPDTRFSDDENTLYHEYVHYLLREHSLIMYPKWFNEGFAELLGETEISKGKVVIGAAPAGRVRTLRSEPEMHVEELLTPRYEANSGRYWSRFYAYSWALTHYLQITSFTENPQLRQQTTEYLYLVHSGEDPIDAFSATFKMTPREMDVELSHYRRARKLSAIELEIGEYNGGIRKRRLTANEQVFLLADIAWRRGEEEVALEYLEDIDIQPDASDAARPLSLSAVLLNHRGDVESAKANASRALALAPDDSQVLSNLAHFEFDNADYADERGGDSRVALENAVSYGSKAAEIDPANLEAYHFLWNSYVKLDQVANAARAMMSAYQLAPSDLSLNFEIGSLTFNQGLYDLSRPFLERVLAWSHSVERQAAVKEMLEQIENEAVVTGEAN